MQIDWDGTILYCNEVLSIWSGFAQRELIGQPLKKIMPERYRNKHRASFAKYIATGKKSIDWISVPVHLLTAGGEEIPIAISFVDQLAGDVRQFVGVIRKREERK